MTVTATPEPRYWIAVACADHVRRGQAGGFMQVCHGKRGPLQRVRAGDVVAYYSPTGSFGGKDRVCAFTALGVVASGEPYQVDMGGGFVPYRRDVGWRATQDAAIAPMLDQLELTRGHRNWGYPFRFGILTVCAADMARIAYAMGVADICQHSSQVVASARGGQCASGRQ